MNYYDGSGIKLGDIVSVPVPDGTAKARVVMLGDTYEHLSIDEQFLDWVKKEKILETTYIVIEWLGENPFENNDPKYASVGNYMFTKVDEWVINEIIQAH
jgi:hypothetical protein